MIGILTVILFLVSIYFKGLEFEGVNLYIYLAGALLFLTFTWAFALGRPHILMKSHVNGSGGYLTLFLLFVIFQPLVILVEPSTQTILLTAAIVTTYHVFFLGLMFGHVRLQRLFGAAAFLSVLSSVLLLLQVHVSLERFDPVPYLVRMGFATDFTQEIPGYAEVLAMRGRGFALSIGEYTIHNFLALFFLGLGLTEVTGVRRLVVATGLGLLGWAIIVSSSGSFNAAVAVALLSYAAVRWAARRRIPPIKRLALTGAVAGVTILILVMVLFGAEYALRHLDASVGNSLTLRLYYWSVASRMFVEHPLVGVGLGTFKLLLFDFPPVLDIFGWQPDPAEVHSLPLMLLSGGGLIGFLLYAAFLGGAVVIAYRNIASPNPAFIDKVVFLTLVGILSQSMVGNHFVILDMYLIAAIAHFRAVAADSIWTKAARMVATSGLGVGRV